MRTLVLVRRASISILIYYLLTVISKISTNIDVFNLVLETAPVELGVTLRDIISVSTHTSHQPPVTANQSHRTC